MQQFTPPSGSVMLSSVVKVGGPFPNAIQAVMGGANDNGYGSMMSGTLEGSNVDITEELVSLIAAQRNFQANAKALDTDNQISQTIFQIQS